MNPEESESKITVYGKEILVPSFGRANPSFPLRIGEFDRLKTYTGSLFAHKNEV